MNATSRHARGVATLVGAVGLAIAIIWLFSRDSTMEPRVDHPVAPERTSLERVSNVDAQSPTPVRTLEVVSDVATARLVVRVVDVQRMRIAGAEVAWVSDADALVVGHTANDGRLEFEVKLREPDSVVSVTARGYRKAVVPLDPDASEVVVTLERGASVRGLVIHRAGSPLREPARVIAWETKRTAPLPGKRATAAFARNPSVFMTTTDAAGAFTLDGLPERASLTLVAAIRGAATRHYTSGIVAPSDGVMVELSTLLGCRAITVDERGAPAHVFGSNRLSGRSSWTQPDGVQFVWNQAPAIAMALEHRESVERADVHQFLAIDSTERPGPRLLRWTLTAPGFEPSVADVPIESFIDAWPTHTVTMRRTATGTGTIEVVMSPSRVDDKAPSLKLTLSSSGKIFGDFQVGSGNRRVLDVPCGSYSVYACSNVDGRACPILTSLPIVVSPSGVVPVVVDVAAFGSLSLDVVTATGAKYDDEIHVAIGTTVPRAGGRSTFAFNSEFIFEHGHADLPFLRAGTYTMGVRLAPLGAHKYFADVVVQPNEQATCTVRIVD